MRRFSWLTGFAILLLFVCIQALPAHAQSVGTHRFSLAIQGSVTSLDQLHSLSQSMPVELRATVVVTIDPPTSGGVQYGRLRLLDAQVRLDEGMAPLTASPAGYRIRLQPNQPPQLVDPALDLEAYGLEVNELLAILFPVPAGQSIAEGATWSLNYSQDLEVAAHALPLPITNTYRVNEIRDTITVVQSTLRGSASLSLNPGHITADQLGSGVLHVDPITGQLIRTAVTVRSTIEKTIPAGARVPEERLQIRTLITTSAERLPDQPVTVPPSLGARYEDPAQRFSLLLPEGWQADPVLIDRSITLFESPDKRERLYIDIAPSAQAQGPIDVARTMLNRYARFLVDFSIVTEPTPDSLDGHPAALAEYHYRDGEQFTEGALYSHIGGYDVALQYSGDPSRYATEGQRLFKSLSEHFTFGPHLGGQVSANQLLLAPSILYESDELAFEIEVPNLWPPVDSSDGSITFSELGGAGRLNIHLEGVAPNESALALLQQWVRRFQSEQPNVEIVTPAEAAALGPLSGASTTFRWTSNGSSITQKLVVANWNGILYVLSIEYASAGFDERAAVFERIVSGFRPLAEAARKQALTFDAYNPPPGPGEASAFLLIGRLVHEYSDAGTTYNLPAKDVRLEMSVKGERYVARTDDDGFFYLANLPVAVGDEIEVEAIRGGLFDLPYDVNIPIQGVTVTAYGPIGLFGQLTLVLNASKTSVGLRMDSGVDDATGVSRIHQFFLNRYPDSPWADLVREDLEVRTTLSQ